MGGMRTEAMRGDPTDDRPRKIGGHTRRHVDDGRARLEAGRGNPTDDRPRAVGGYARLELMHGFEIWGCWRSIISAGRSIDKMELVNESFTSSYSGR